MKTSQWPFKCTYCYKHSYDSSAVHFCSRWLILNLSTTLILLLSWKLKKKYWCCVKTVLKRHYAPFNIPLIHYWMCKIQVYLYYVHILLRTLGGASESNKILRKSYASVNGGQLNVSMLFLHNNNDKKKNSPLEPQIYDQIAFANLFCDIYMYIMYCILIYIQT